MADFFDFITSTGLSDAGFVGSKFTWTNNSIWKHLDRVLLSSNWVEYFNSFRVEDLHRGSYDHCPLQISAPFFPRQSVSFRFQNMWFSQKRFMQTVMLNWNNPCPDNDLSRLVFKLKRLKNNLKWWNKNVFGNVHEKVKALDQKASQAQVKFDDTPFKENRTALSLALANLALGLYMEEDFWNKKSSAKWIMKGEKNTVLFHNMVNRSLLTGEPLVLSEPKFDNISVLITEEDNRFLLEPLSEKEFHLDSIAGPDRFSARFYRNYWEIVKADVIDAAREFWSSTSLPRSITTTSLILIPKIFEAEIWSDFRPISLCNVRDGSSFKSSNEWGKYYVELDMAKDYDKVQWDFLYQMLRDFGFLEGFCQVILQCVNNCWFSVMVNGSLSGFFHSKIGLMQGDPISPTMFIIAVEYLSRGLDNLFARHRTLHISTGCPFRISHLAYVDDLIIFANGSISGIKIIRKFLFHYEQCSDQLIRNAKSVVLTVSNCPPQKKGKYLEITGFGEGSLPIKYLDDPLFIGPKKSFYFLPIISSATKKLQGWDTQLLSFGSRLCSLRGLFCIDSICYVQNSYKELRREIGKFIRFLGRIFVFQFLKGFRSVDSLWSKFLVTRYYKFDPPVAVQTKPNISPIWRQMMKIKGRAEQEIGWRIGEGLLSFWFDSWFPDGPISSLTIIQGNSSRHVEWFLEDHKWNLARLLLVVPPHIAYRIMDVPIHPISKDVAVWKPTLIGGSLKEFRLMISFRKGEFIWLRFAKDVATKSLLIIYFLSVSLQLVCGNILVGSSEFKIFFSSLIERVRMKCRLAEVDFLAALAILNADFSSCELTGIVNKIQTILLDSEVRKSHIYRKANGAANELANLGLDLGSAILHPTDIYGKLKGICRLDKSGLLYIRVKSIVS
ncbi:uncharacterized protein [Henckelia pumila]|uniref:uncharacterized protein n=1 Tax=Henckelia pumila TaxID=405737 RepID=UPI003C6DDAF4